MTRNFSKSLTLIGGAFAALGSSAAWAQHPTPPAGASVLPQAGPANAQIELENESMVVVRVRMAPHEKTPRHDISRARLVVWLTDVHLRDAHPDGSADETRRKPGDIDWVPVQRHAGENLSQEPLEFLAIVPKIAPAPRPTK
jgi:quercetin dioxygenase-like cupin family protein